MGKNITFFFVDRGDSLPTRSNYIFFCLSVWQKSVPSTGVRFPIQTLKQRCIFSPLMLTAKRVSSVFFFHGASGFSSIFGGQKRTKKKIVNRFLVLGKFSHFSLTLAICYSS